MSDLPHLRLEGTQETARYTYAGPKPTGVEFDLPPRNPASHATTIKNGLQGADTEATKQRAGGDGQAAPIEHQPEGLVLTFQGDPGHELNLKGLERQGRSIHLLGVSEVNGVPTARVFVPQGQLAQFLRLVDAYAASVILTFQAEADQEARLKGLANPEKGIKLFGTVRKTKDNKIKISFAVPEAEAAGFQQQVGEGVTHLSTSRKNNKLIDSITSVRLAIVEDFWQDTLAFPGPDDRIWWEVWLRGNRGEASNVATRFRELATAAGFARISDQHVAFPERVVLHALATARQFSDSIDVLTMVAELRKAKELAADYVRLAPREQREFTNELLDRLTAPGPKAPSVCILDGGVNRGHPLIGPALATEDMHTANTAWGVHEPKNESHGTGMAGNALFGCLTEVLTTAGPVILRHRLESAKILPPPTLSNEPEVFGSVTQQAVSEAYIKAPHRNRVLCMAVTSDDRDLGMPTVWSGAIDDMCAGVLDEMPKLMLISAGNVKIEDFHSPNYAYHEWNTTRAGIEDPGQAWNALTIGAITTKVFIEHKDDRGLQPIASTGDLCPTSRTSLPWPSDNQSGWPVKPDLVMEGGNYAEKGDSRSHVDDLSLLTTIVHPTGRLFETTRDTSPATACASRLAAVLWSHYPHLWPETVRALLVHSASWTPAMLKRFPDNRKRTVHQCLRCYGYGVPDLGRAINSAKNAVTLIFEGELQPFRKEKSQIKTHEMHVHALPWPTEVLEGLGAEGVKMRVTLSYFIEPSPNRVGWGTNHRYQSHGLRFDVIRPTEGVEEFKKRVSSTDWEGGKRPKAVAESRNWVIGDQGRTHGSLHSDWWEGTAADLARCGRIIVYPVTGWWKERAHLRRYERKARYSLVVTIETGNVEADLYQAITAQAKVKAEVLV